MKSRDLNYYTINGMQESDVQAIRDFFGWSDSTSNAKTVASRPSLKRGTLAARVMVVLNSRKNPITTSELSQAIARKYNRSFTNARLYPILLQLSNWNHIEVHQEDNVLTRFSAN